MIGAVELLAMGATKKSSWMNATIAAVTGTEQAIRPAGSLVSPMVSVAARNGTPIQIAATSPALIEIEAATCSGMYAMGGKRPFDALAFLLVAAASALER